MELKAEVAKIIQNETPDAREDSNPSKHKSKGSLPLRAQMESDVPEEHGVVQL